MIDENTESNSKAGARWVKDIWLLVDRLKHRCTFDTSTREWYIHNLTHWVKIDYSEIHEIVTGELLKLEQQGELSIPIPLQGFSNHCNDYVTLLERYIPVGFYIKPAPRGINFLNGFFDLSQMKLVNRSWSLFVTETLQADYKGLSPDIEAGDSRLQGALMVRLYIERYLLKGVIPRSVNTFEDSEEDIDSDDESDVNNGV